MYPHYLPEINPSFLSEYAIKNPTSTKLQQNITHKKTATKSNKIYFLILVCAWLSALNVFMAKITTNVCNKLERATN
ncbi:hypothetical protein CAP35_11140 [Chitinophagaceae bacterium IBVUCB1]|nr:hypothetical protein CAP35_11140 [Chitinophagaceae bacterium IBVUCB1]